MSSEFPKIELEGGPMARGLKLKINGEEVDKVTGISIYADVNDVVRVETRQIASIAKLSVRGALDEKKLVSADLQLFFPETNGLENWMNFSGQGETLREAVIAALASAEMALEKAG